MEQPPIKIGTQLRPSARLTIAPQIEPWFAVAWFRRHVAAQAVAEAERLEALVEIAIEDQYAAEANFAVDQELDVVALSATEQQEIQNLEAQAASLLIHASPLNEIRRIKLSAPEPVANPTMLAEIDRLEQEVKLGINGPDIQAEITHYDQGYRSIPETEVPTLDSWYAAYQDALRRASIERVEKPYRIRKLREAVAEDLRRQALEIRRQTDEQELLLREEHERVAFQNKQQAYALRERARMLRDNVEASGRVRQRGLKRATIIEKLRHTAGKKTRTEQWEATLEQARLLRLAADCIERHDEDVGKDSVEVSRFALERHAFIVGVPGFGKTRLITHLLKEQMQARCSVIYIDPKPDATRVLLSAAIDAQVRPENIIIIDPASGVPVPGWNPFLQENLSPDVIASGLKDFVQSMSTSWGPFMDELMDCALTIVAHHRLSLRECLALIERPAYRRALLSRQPVSGGSLEYNEAVEYFQHRFERHESSIESVTVRLRALLNKPLFRALLCAQENTMDLATLWDEQKVVIAHLDQVLLNDGGAEVIACLLATQTFLTAMRVGSERTRPVVLSMDELGTQEKFMGKRIAEIVAFSRSQGLRILAAVQYFNKVSPSLLDAMRNSAHLKVYFQMGSEDANKVAGELAMTAGRVPVQPGADVTVSMDKEEVVHYFPITGSDKQGLYSYEHTYPPYPPVVVPDVPVAPVMPELPKPTMPQISLSPPVRPVMPTLPAPPQPKLSAAETAHAQQMKQYELQLAQFNWEQENRLLNFLSPHKRVELTAEQRNLIKRHDADVAAQLQFMNDQVGRTGVFAEYQMSLDSFNRKIKEYQSAKKAYDVALRTYEEAVRQYQADVAQQQKDWEARKLESQQNAEWQAGLNANKVYAERVIEMLEDHRSAMEAKAKRWFPHEPDVAAMMGFLWTNCGNDTFDIHPFEGTNPVELSRFVHALPSYENGRKRIWKFCVVADGELFVRVQMPTASVTVQPIPPCRRRKTTGRSLNRYASPIRSGALDRKQTRPPFRNPHSSCRRGRRSSRRGP